MAEMLFFKVEIDGIMFVFPYLTVMCTLGTANIYDFYTQIYTSNNVEFQL